MPEDTAPGPGEGEGPSPDERTWATAGHLSGFVWLIGVPGPLGPLAVWLLKRHEHAFADDQALEALNFQLSVLAYALVIGVIAGVLALTGARMGPMAVVPSALLGALLVVFWLAFTIRGAYRSSEGERYRYPMTVRWIG